ncbi:MULTISPECIES: NAD(P)/FAD-dependent oxidoreductase [unclassified Bradyrhizobium]|uniref:NAD(P)/FAD-dependent oxidoreductase n=1 Tax=unclassified Bradyrhizobium TaxID=2631580 RepID=UPI001BAC3A11|nr:MULTISPECIES: FAD-dependent oxidoreductase [unclassified Bradyrhizobium]MBR1206914.1 FAD-dependent oxidoreductase [Bradyrhizobium sp. AUGA SZCCT0124]MBR1313453.1 FAD-dependent oxidoreductase [Bradyrhizobium sp. AUGA SZCCT0051]MBR1343450.1 FAD-dependent oxidoreductase [Bradyrhizobium sp. AUGA SZCCT0105]MBR1357130.1 FAD-dependent oxidoreductase [Bradyrhizobium sp. AUGA SZCCT0045]
MNIAVVGTGISGLSAAWLLSQRHDVTVYEKSDRIGGHSNTVIASIGHERVAVDTGFIVFNRSTYPNLSALFRHLDVATQASEMSLSVSLDRGNLEYSGTGLAGLLVQPGNLLRLRFWSMLRDVVRFYDRATRDAARLNDETISLGDYLAQGGYSSAFRDDHLLPMASAIWSAPPDEILAFPAATFIRFHHNHGLLQLTRRPPWETVIGGSQVYVQRLVQPFADRIRLDCGVVRIRRSSGRVMVTDVHGETQPYDHVVLATHANQALSTIDDPTPDEAELLGAFRYSRNLAVLHSDPRFMPRRRPAWSSWNYVGSRDKAAAPVGVTYWMNRLQGIPQHLPLFVTLNPAHPPHSETLHHTEVYEHPIFDAAAIVAQRRLWSLQGQKNTWFCGAHFGAGFHEDGLQSGLAVAEQLGGARRPWTVSDESGRIALAASARSLPEPELQP